jgi:hypothetical protein
MLPLHHMRNILDYIKLDQIILLYIIHPARLEHAVCSSEVRRVTNYAKDAIYMYKKRLYVLLYLY